MNVKLKNSFHNTEITIRIPQEVFGTGMEYAWLEREKPRTARKVKRALCGFKDCTCGVVR